MDYRIEKKGAMRFKGLTRVITTDMGKNNQLIPEFWAEFGQLKGAEDIVENIGPLGLIGAMYKIDDHHMRYMIGVEGKETISHEAIESLDIPSATWAVFTSKGKLPEAIQDVWKKIYSDFFPGSTYQHAMLPELEVYPDGDTTDENYCCEVWIPIIEK